MMFEYFWETMGWIFIFSMVLASLIGWISYIFGVYRERRYIKKYYTEEARDEIEKLTKQLQLREKELSNLKIKYQDILRRANITKKAWSL